jgi:hypothetical protein
MLSQQALAELGSAVSALRDDLGEGSEAAIPREKLEDLLDALDGLASSLTYDLMNLEEATGSSDDEDDA